MSKREEFNSALKTALKNKDQVAMSTIRLILAALKDRDISARGNGNADGVDDNEILSMLQSMIKQRKESVTTYRDAGREDLAEREEAEIEVIQGFLPQQLGEKEVSAELDKIIDELDAKDIKDMGRVMGALKERFAGQIDMGKASAQVREKLSA